MELVEIDQKPDKMKISALLYNMGTRKAEKVMQTFKYGKKRIPDANEPARIVEVEEKDTCYEDVLNKFDRHFIPRVNIVNESAKFNKRCQQSGESVDDFLIDLQQLVQKCEYQDPDRQIRDRLIAGLRDQKLQEKLQFTADITLEGAVEYARRWESLQNELEQQRSSELQTDEIRHRNGRRGRSYGRGRGRGGSRGTGQQNSKNPCKNCGYSYHKNPTCPALKAKCNKCQQIGHFSSVCKPSRANEVEATSEVVMPTYTDFDAFLGAVDCTEANRSAWYINLPILSDCVKFKIDTGADVTIMSKTAYDELRKPPPLQMSRLNLSSPGGTVSVVGEFTAETTYKDTAYRIRVFVTSGNDSNLLSRESNKNGSCSTLGRDTADWLTENKSSNYPFNR